MDALIIILIVMIAVTIVSCVISSKSKKQPDDKLTEMANKFVKNDEWSMSQEREFFENLYSQRINFYIIVFSAVVTGILAARERNEKIVVFLIGLYLTMITGLSLYRACHKLLLILKILHHSKNHPVKEIGKLASERPWLFSFSINHLTGLWMPMFSFLMLFAWFIVYLIKG